MAIRLLLLFVATIWSFSGSVRAEQLTFSVGGAEIAIPEAPGLVSLRNSDSPYFRFLAELQAANKNRLLGVLLPPDMAVKADAGVMPSPKEWAIVYTLGPGGSQPITLEQFQKEFLPAVDAHLEKAIADQRVQQLTDAAMDRAVGNLLAEQNTEAGAAKLRLGVISPLGVYARAPTYYLYGAATKLSVTSPAGVSEEKPIVMVLGFITVQSRLFAIGVYRTPTTLQDIEAAKSRAMAWAEAIARANP